MLLPGFTPVVWRRQAYASVVYILHCQDMEDQDIRNRIVRKMLRKRITGNHKKQIDTVVNMSLPSHEQGRGKQLIEEMVSDPDAPIVAYGGGHRNNVHLANVEDAVDYLKRHGGDLPFGFD